MNDYLWVEKYRPSSVEQCILPKSIKEAVNGFVENKTLPGLLLCGSPGTGKTTVALALCNDLGYESMILNGSNEGRILDTFRTKIAEFAGSMSFDGGRKCVIIDEADFMPNEPQALLRHFIEEYSSNCTFILTCNFPNRIIDALHSRCSVLDYTIPNDERDMMLASQVRAVLNVLSKEGIEHDKRVVGMLVKKHFPDMRRVLNELQRYSVVGKIDSGIFTVGTDTAFNELIPILKEKHFNNMRKWVAAQANLDIAQISKKLYNHADEIFKQDAVPQLVLHLADYQYKSAFVADKEINVVAMLTSIMVDC